MTTVETVVVTGDREWANRPRVEVVIADLVRGGLRTLVHGGARGLDRMAAEVATEHGVDVKRMPYEGRLGVAGGPVRNRRMLEEWNPQLVVAFHDCLDESRGTRGCVVMALERGLPVLWVTSWGQTYIGSLEEVGHRGGS
jgi:hypothetical protein